MNNQLRITKEAEVEEWLRVLRQPSIRSANLLREKCPGLQSALENPDGNKQKGGPSNKTNRMRPAPIKIPHFNENNTTPRTSNSLSVANRSNNNRSPPLSNNETPTLSNPTKNVLIVPNQNNITRKMNKPLPTLTFHNTGNNNKTPVLEKPAMRNGSFVQPNKSVVDPSNK